MRRFLIVVLVSALAGCAGSGGGSGGSGGAGNLVITSVIASPMRVAPGGTVLLTVKGSHLSTGLTGQLSGGGTCQTPLGSASLITVSCVAPLTGTSTTFTLVSGGTPIPGGSLTIQIERFPTVTSISTTPAAPIPAGTAFVASVLGSNLSTSLTGSLSGGGSCQSPGGNSSSLTFSCHAPTSGSTTTFTLTDGNTAVLGISTLSILLKGGNVPVPVRGAYFGAFVNPPGTTNQETATETLETSIGRTLALHMHYYPWGNGTTPNFPDAAMQEDLIKGRVPVVSWKCGDLDSNVADGADDPLIINTAKAVKAFGGPVFIRWFWEMNIPNSNGQGSCLGTAGAAGYIAAWQHIHDIFAAQGVTNVSWLWNPGNNLGHPDPAPYYPGSNYVDWIGFDGYDKYNYDNFGSVFNGFYAEFASYGKPMLVAETGECPSEQAVYLQSAQTEIGGGMIPLVKGFMYFDAPGNYTACSWVLGASGLSAFAAMGATTFFSQTP